MVASRRFAGHVRTHEDSRLRLARRAITLYSAPRLPSLRRGKTQINSLAGVRRAPAKSTSTKTRNSGHGDYDVGDFLGAKIRQTPSISNSAANCAALSE
jgi:hypothetical protein